MQSTEGTPLDGLALVAKEVGIPELHRIIRIGKTVLARPSHGISQIPEWNKTQTSCEKGLFTQSGTSAWGTGFRFHTHLVAKEVIPVNLSRETQSLCTPLALLQLNKASQKGANTLSGALIFSTVTQGTPPDFLMLRPAGIIIAAPQDSMHLHT